MMRLGAVADDVTGACDLAGRVVEAGLPAVVILGDAGDTEVRELFPPESAGCAVVALTVRTAPVAEAVAAAADAAHLLLRAGASLLYQKYCSTFDSTAEGNIGPIADELARLASSGGEPAITVGTPATPSAGRTQYSGTLFVDGVPLAESSMRHHPLTPMRDSDVVRLLRPQTPAPVRLVRWEDVQLGAPRIAALASAAGTGHVLVDALTEHDLDTATRAVLLLARERPVVAGGGAGLTAALARAAAATPSSAGRSRTAPAAPAETDLPCVPLTGRLILVGSASAATRSQLAAFTGERHLLDPVALDRSAAELERLRSAVAAPRPPETPLLIAAHPEVERAQQALGAARAAQLVEGALAELAGFAVHEAAVSHLIVAGGETSGAVTTRLGVRRLTVGLQAAPGVPWTVAHSGERTVALLLKSGNFGGDGLFDEAWDVAP